LWLIPASFNPMPAETGARRYVTLVAIATMAFVVACVGHEAVGHGGMCLARGEHVILLTSVYFQCSTGSPITDAAGPLMNLFLGAMFWLALRLVTPWPTNWRLFLAFSMAFNLFWGAGYFVFSAVTNSGDWAFVLRDLALEPRNLWRCGMGVLGVGLYYGAMQLVAVYLQAGTPLMLPYISAGVISCLAALFYAGPSLPAIREAAQESFGAAIGLLLMARNRQRKLTPRALSATPSWSWIFASVVVLTGFILTLGRGFVASRAP
jgi:hypothetical protein